MPTTPFNPTDIINSVSSFYEIAWNHLLWFVAVAGAIIGVAVPFLIQLYQRRLFKVEETEINKKVDIRLGELQTEMTNTLTERLKQEMQVFDRKLEVKEAGLNKRTAKTQGNIFHVQGYMLYQQKLYANALDSFLDAAVFQIEGKDEYNLGRVLKLIIECLQSVTKADLVAYGEDKTKVNYLIAQLKDNNENGRYEDIINELNKEYAAATERNEPLNK